jgi:Trk K+ transport system NAD-binding subunit
VEIKIPSNSAVVGKRVKDLLLPQQSLISLVIDEDGVPKVPTDDTVIRASDEVVVVTRRENQEALRQVLTSPGGLSSEPASAGS